MLKARLYGAAFSSSSDKQRLPLQRQRCACYICFGVRDLARGFALIMGIMSLNARALVEIYGINARRASKLRPYRSSHPPDDPRLADSRRSLAAIE
jgi:hypothetical protein